MLKRILVVTAIGCSLLLATAGSAATPYGMTPSQLKKMKSEVRSVIAKTLTLQTQGNMHVTKPFTKSSVSLTTIRPAMIEIMVPAGHTLLDVGWRTKSPCFAGMCHVDVDLTKVKPGVRLHADDLHITNRPRGIR